MTESLGSQDPKFLFPVQASIAVLFAGDYGSNNNKLVAGLSSCKILRYKMPNFTFYKNILKKIQ